jgi:DNA-binding transcriptional MocR family regulator
MQGEIMAAFSRAAQRMRSSEIRRLMKLAADPSIISFAGGMPNNGLFPVDVIPKLWEELGDDIQKQAFQYCPTSGYPKLLEAVAEYLRAKQLPVDTNSLLITTGAQQAINLTAKVLLDPGDSVICEYPSFIGALAAFKSYEAQLHGVKMDDNGMLIDELEKAYASCSKTAKLLYISPCFHNPAGIIYSEDRKKALIDFIQDKQLCMLEDDAYGELYFDESDKALTVPMKAIAGDDACICYTGSFAKIFGPGMRLGWLLGPEEIMQKAELAKQSMDACSPAFTQTLAWAFLTKGHLEPYLEMLRPIYKRRAEIMLKALEQHMPEGVSWTTPKGGFYVWVRLPEEANATDVFNASIEKGAAFVIGSAFDPLGTRNNCFRLAFSHTPEERIAEGIKIVAESAKAVVRKS